MEKWTERSEYLSELHLLLNTAKAQVMEYERAIMRESNNLDAKKANTVTPETKKLLEQAPTPISYARRLREQAGEQSDTKQMTVRPPYLHLIQ